MVNLKYYLELDDESLSLLADSQVTIEDVVERAGINGTVSYATAPYSDREGEKELATVILASGITAALVISKIAKVLQVYLGRPKFVEVSEVSELRDASGEVVRDAYGRPQYTTKSRVNLLQPITQDDLSVLESSIDWRNGIVIKLHDSKKGGQSG